MLDQTFLDKWTKILVPREYGPDRKLENNKPLLCVTLYSSEDMEQFKKRFYPEAEETDELRGHILNMGLFMKYAKTKNYEKYVDRYLIKINSGLTEEAGIFALLHETGHLCGFITKSSEHGSEPDEFADNYALRKIKELIEEPSLRLKVLLEGLSSNFKHR